MPVSGLTPRPTSSTRRASTPPSSSGSRPSLASTTASPTPAPPLNWTAGYDYNNPTATSSSGTADPNLAADRTDELIIGFDKQIGNQFAVSASYIWRKYTNFRSNAKNGFSADNWVKKEFAPTGCPTGATCPTVTCYEPNARIPTAYTSTNVKDYWRGYQGLELTARKRMSKNWTMNGSFSWNDAKQHFDSGAANAWWDTSFDPTQVQSLNNAQYAPESTSSGLGNVFVNARWIARVSGSYTLPWWQINVAAFYNARDGYPFIRSVQTGTRPFSASRATVYLEPRGDLRLPTFQTADFRVDKAFTVVGRVRVVASVDIFNLLNGNTTLSMRGGQNAADANTISSLLAPRVVRFGARVTW